MKRNKNKKGLTVNQAVSVSILLLIEKEVILCRIIGPDVFDGIVHFAVFFQIFKILDHFERSSRAGGIIDEFFPGCGPRGIFQFGCEFQCPIHTRIVLRFLEMGRKYIKKTIQQNIYVNFYGSQ